MNKRLDQIASLVQREAPGLSPEAFGIFMIIAREDSMSLKLLARELDIPQPRVVRHIAELSAWEFEGQRGAGLVRLREKESLDSEVVLSPRGKNLKEQIERVIQGQHPV